MAYEKHKDFMRKHVTASETPIFGSHLLSNMWPVSKQLRPCYGSKMLISNNKKLVGEK